MSWQVICGDAITELAKLPECSAHCSVTSPPYFGLRAYKAGDREIGRERTVQEYVDNLVAVFREVRRILRDDGLMFVNLGSSYAGGGRNAGNSIEKTSIKQRTNIHSMATVKPDTPEGYKSGDLIDVPHLVGDALRRDGWYLRQIITWVKGLSLCPTYSGSCMPESAGANGTYWVKHRVKVNSTRWDKSTQATAVNTGVRDHVGNLENCPRHQWRDCPGCAKCEATGGWVLRRGNGRPTSSTEIVLMLAKSAHYFFDAEAVKEPHQRDWSGSHGDNNSKVADVIGGQKPHMGIRNSVPSVSGRCLRSAWAINPGGNSDVSGRHFAMFPPKLPETCIKMATSEHGVCPKCGAPWARMIEKQRVSKPTWAMKVAGCNSAGEYGGEDTGDYTSGGAQSPASSKRSILETMATPSSTVGWLPTCECDAGDPIPATVLDPFSGMATSGIAALKLGRSYVGIELSEDYAERSRKRLEHATKQGKLL